MYAWVRTLQHPIRHLIVLFLCWKLGLLLISASSPGRGYDTSSNLDVSSQQDLSLPLRYVSEKLTRWDAIYFTNIARRGYLFEQEWAFGWGFTQLIAFCTAGLMTIGVSSYAGIESLVAIIIAHIGHLVSVITLFGLTSTIFPEQPPEFAFTAAFLHIISPAGLFLSAPYAESSCAFLSFVGCLFFAKSFAGKKSARQDLLILLSGILFGTATAFRSNAVLNGLLLLEEALRTLWHLRNGIQVSTLRRLLATGFGGISVVAGFLLPQFIAYREYCGYDTTANRPWCMESLPSIYAFVQSHYWGVRWFGYWKLTNLPLFLLAAPMFTLLIISGLWGLFLGPSGDNKIAEHPKSTKTTECASRQIRQNLAVSQLLLVFLTLTTAHVQIITRISSSYPVWVWYTSTLSANNQNRLAGALVKFMVMYGFIQAGLYSSFLPPA